MNTAAHPIFGALIRNSIVIPKITMPAYSAGPSSARERIAASRPAGLDDPRLSAASSHWKIAIVITATKYHQVVADRYAEMRARRVVPENPAEEPAVAEHAQRIDHHVHHHHEQRRHQPYARRAPDFPGVENSKIRAATIQG